MLERMAKTTSITVQRLSGALGAEVRGIDLETADLEVVGPEIAHLFGEHHALFFPDQNLTPPRMAALIGRFGKPLIHPYLKSLPECEEVHELRKTPSDDVAFGNLWHTDFTNLEFPSLANALYSIEVPEHGGDTVIASTCAAFEALSIGMQDMLRGLNAIHGFSERYKQDLRDQAAREGVARDDDASSDYSQTFAEVTHPVVRHHPGSGRESLYVNPGFTLRIENMTDAESQPLLHFLYRHCEQPEFGMRYTWAASTLGIWDNRSTLHYATNDYAGQLRVMHRMVVLETERPEPTRHRS